MDQYENPPLSKPIFIRIYIPLAAAFGMTFLTWLFGSLTYRAEHRKCRASDPGSGLQPGDPDHHPGPGESNYHHHRPKMAY